MRKIGGNVERTGVSGRSWNSKDPEMTVVVAPLPPMSRWNASWNVPPRVTCWPLARIISYRSDTRLFGLSLSLCA